MAEPQNQDQPIQGPMSITVGGNEGQPVNIEAQRSPEILKSSHELPQISDEVQATGVKNSPIVSRTAIEEIAKEQDVSQAGLQSSSFASSNLNIGDAERIAKTGDIKTSSPWRALLDFIKRLREGNRQNKELSQEA